MATNVRGAGWSVLVWGGATLLLLAPAVAMRFTTEVQWTGFDFAVFGAMLLLGCSAFEFVSRRSNGLLFTLGTAMAVGTAFFLLWANLAVGLIGDEGNRANLMYIGVLLTAIVGACVARFRPRGMSRAMVAAGVAQAVVGAIALVGKLGDSQIETFGVTAMFVVLWMAASVLFAKSATR